MKSELTIDTKIILIIEPGSILFNIVIDIFLDRP